MSEYLLLTCNCKTGKFLLPIQYLLKALRLSCPFDVATILLLFLFFKIIQMNFSSKGIVLLLLCLAIGSHQLFAQATFNPVTTAQGFNIFTRNNIIAKAGDTHGPVAMGGDLQLNGSTIFAMSTSGTYPANNLNDYSNYGMVIGGKIIYTGGNSSQLNQGFIRLGDAAGSTLWYTDENNAASNLRITPGGFNSNPQVTLQRQQAAGTATTPSGLNFGAAFSQLVINASKINGLASGTCQSSLNKIVIPAVSNPHITLVDNKVNLIEMTGAQLNNLNTLGSIIFDNKPSAARIVVWNIIASGSFTWTTPNLGGVDEDNGSYMIWNFYNTTGVTLTGGNSVYGTIFAPSADVVKSGANNLNGQAIAKSFEMGYGEVHYYPFSGLIPDCPAGGVVALNRIEVAAALTGNTSNVSWVCDDEADVIGYELERSADAVHYTTIASPAKSSLNAGHYSFSETLAGDDNIYYRVKVINISGAFYYSKVVAVKVKSTSALEIWPVPANDVLNISYKSVADQKIALVISDNAGRAALQKSVTVKKGMNQFVNAEVSRLSPGIYFLRIIAGDEVLVKKFVKL
jgi:choice-of-anchor A domain-containing protein